MLKTEFSVHINAPREQVFDLLAHPELLAEPLETVRSVKVISRDADSLLTETVAGTDHRDTRLVVENHFFPPDRIDIHQIKGELRTLNGADILEVEDGGTRVTEILEFEIGLPLFGNLLGNMGIRQLVEEQSRDRLRALRKLAESPHPR